MRVIYTAPQETPYSDNTTWFDMSRSFKGKTTAMGVWLKPGERVVILPPEESEKKESPY